MSTAQPEFDGQSDRPSIAPRPFLGRKVSELRRFGLAQPQGDYDKKSRPQQIALAPQGAVEGAIRQYLTPEEGEGFWDFMEVRKGLFLAITDAAYNVRAEMKLPAEPIIKIRVILSGSIEEIESGRTLRSGEVSIQSFAGDKGSAYAIEPEGHRLQMVVLHCQMAAFASLAEALRNSGSPFFELGRSGAMTNTSISLGSSIGIIQIARHIFDSRDHFIPALRHHYLTAKSEELLCWAMDKCRPGEALRVGANRLRQRDIVRLHEVRSIILSDYANVPTLHELSRMVALNSTKIKLGFRELFGETIGAFTQRVRLHSASQLVETTDLPFSQIAYKVGYAYPANFTKAFKQEFGVTPSEARKLKPPAQ